MTNPIPTKTIARNAVVLTIAGSDPSGGAGVQVDLKTFQQLGCYGMAAISLLTVQNTQGVVRVEPLAPELVTDQIDAAATDIRPRIIKTGALGNAKLVEAVGEKLAALRTPLVVDPVMVSKHGDSLVADNVVEAYRNHLLPLTTVLTPNHYEAEKLVGRKLTSLQEVANAAVEIHAMGPMVVVIKTGIQPGFRDHMIAGPENVFSLQTEAVKSTQTHGAGCAFSALIAGHLTLTVHTEVTVQNVEASIDFASTQVVHAIENAPKLGQGTGPLETRIFHFDLPSI